MPLPVLGPKGLRSGSACHRGTWLLIDDRTWWSDVCSETCSGLVLLPSESFQQVGRLLMARCESLCITAGQGPPEVHAFTDQGQPLIQMAQLREGSAEVGHSRRMPHTRAAARLWVLPGIAPDVQKIVPSGEAITCAFMPCTRCLPEK